MALDLGAFNPQTEVARPGLSAYNPPVTPTPTANSATINTLAAQGAALDPEGKMEQTYNNVTLELNNGPASPTLDAIISQWDQQEYSAAYETMKAAVADPTLSPEEKSGMFAGFTRYHLEQTLSSRVARSAIISPSEGETKEGATVREWLDKFQAQEDEYRNFVQKQTNAIENTINPTTIDHFNGFMETLIPFMDNANQAYINSQLGPLLGGGVGNTGDVMRTLLLSGEGKTAIIQAIQSLPVEKRTEVASKLFEIVRATRGSIVSDNQEAKALAQLKQMLTPGGYTGVDRWADNIFSVLDDLVFLKPVTALAKSIGKSVKAAKAAGAAELKVGHLSDVPKAQEAEPMLMIEWKPTAEPSYTQSIDDVIDNLPVEATGDELTNLRRNITDQLYKPEGMSIDTIIDDTTITDKLTSTQINDLRQSLGRIRDARKEHIEKSMPATPVTLEEVSKKAVRTSEPATSIKRVYHDTNPEKARAAHAAVVTDLSGRMAEVVAGTTRTEAVASDILPEIGNSQGRVINKVEMSNDEAAPRPDKATVNQSLYSKQGRLEFQPDEKAAMRSSVRNDWMKTVGLTPRPSMSTISDVDDGVKFDMVYGPKEEGYSDAIKGMEIVKVALRKYGITDDQIEVISRDRGSNGGYTPVRPNTDLRNGNFLIRVKANYRFSPNDIVSWNDYSNAPIFSKLDVHTGVGSGRSGGITAHLVPWGSVIDTRLFGTAGRAGDRASALQTKITQIAKDFQTKYNKLDATQKVLVDKYIRYANEHGIPFNSSKMKAAGLNDEAVVAMNDWKKANDTVWWLDNIDVNRRIRNEGYGLLIHKGSDTQLLVKPEAKASHNSLRRYLDPYSGKVRYAEAKEIEEMYENGGTIAKLRRTETFNDEAVDYILVRNTPDAGYLRRLNDDDVTLAYRDGYYHVRYKDPYFIQRKYKDTDGEERYETIARAGSKQDADLEVGRLNAASDGSVYSRVESRLDRDNFDNELDARFASGSSSQRYRGERLQKVGSDKGISDRDIESPADSLVRSIASVSYKVHLREVIATAKARWVAQFGHLTPHAKKNYAHYPESIDRIGKSDKFGEASNARTTWRYIESLENGYVNLVDDVTKGFLNGVSDTAGNVKSWGWVDKLAGGVEKGARAMARGSVTGVAKKTAFKMFISTNPLGQAVVQFAPAITLVGTRNPRYAFSNTFARDIQYLYSVNHGVDTEAYTKLMKEKDKQYFINLREDWEASGLRSAVSSHAYITDTMGRMADRNIIQSGLSTLAKPLNIAQKYGFEMAEESLMQVVWTSERNRMLRKLKKTSLTAEENDRLAITVRALTGDMHRTGSLPYNSNSLSIAMQFMQAPHKMVGNLVFGHRGLEKGDRYKLLAGYVATFGIGWDPLVNAIANQVAPGDEGVRNIIKGGLLNLALNNFIGVVTGGDTGNVDFSSRVHPTNPQSLIDFVGGIISGTIPEAVASGAFPSMLQSGSNVQQFLSAVAAPFVPGTYDGVDELAQVAHTFADMFPGLSNAGKAAYILETGKAKMRDGRVLQEDLNFMEGLARAFGFKTYAEVKDYASKGAAYEASTKAKEDVALLVDDYFLKLSREGITADDLHNYTRILGECGRAFNNNPHMMNLCADRVAYKMGDDPSAFFNQVLKMVGWAPKEKILEALHNEAITPEGRDMIMDMIKYFEETK